MEEEIKVLQSCWVMTTDHVLDEGNIALKLAIKNIIQAYKQLEKENKELKFRIRDNYISRGEYNKAKAIMTKELRYDYIPKSIIREELRTLKNMLPTALHETSRAVFNGEIALLERILGDEDENRN